MKIQCNACEAAEATVMCCADEAALCSACDEKVHRANKLAGKHQRVPLVAASSPSGLPKCDICQEASGYFFCLEDRALFCRNCDVSIHTANSYVSAHRRFLVTGVQVGLEPADPLPSFPKEQASSSGRVSERPTKLLPEGNSSMLFAGEANQVFSNQASKGGYVPTAKTSYSGVNMVGGLPDWSVDDFFGFINFNQNYGYPENSSSKADSGKLGSSDDSPPYFPADERINFDECLGQVPEISYNTVPEIPSPPTASGFHLQRNLLYPPSEHAVFVPDICSSHNRYGYQGNPKRRRSF
ncbi:B-box zinc finger protein 22-like [Asparagus officinalis]|uniref:B-box zinc finger protein 22-like n=1 Tax=Asparagus officinalis TaxID=4686 RepID=UPI00098DEC88|nr:B-box zinc finger protein 22-like [Asparagus officinalis]